MSFVVFNPGALEMANLRRLPPTGFGRFTKLKLFTKSNAFSNAPPGA